VAGKPVRGELPPDADRIFALSLADPDADPATEANRYRPPFGHMALLLQVPGPDVLERLESEKGAPLDEAERAGAVERVAAAEAWLRDFAPAEARLVIQYDALPESARDLNDVQRSYLATLADAVEQEDPHGGESWQALIFRTSQELGMKAGEAFGALYRVFLDRPNGPRAGWLLASLDRPFVVDRLREAAR
jgi:lysyl-tRNA synthetase, class I